jgi:hypothetical protein
MARLDFHSPANSKAIGYGRAYLEIRNSLISLGADLTEPYTGDGIQIYMGTPLDDLHKYYERRSDKFLIYTMWESSKPIPEIIRNINLFDGIITPSKWCEKIYRDLGFTKPIYIVPLGINPDDWQYIERRRKEDVFTVLWQGTFINAKGDDLPFEAMPDRKGGNLVMQAFRELKDSGRLPKCAQLFLKINPRYTINHLQGMLQTADDVLLIADLMSEDKLKSMFAFADASVYPSYAEGFGLIPLEHLACGLPLIIANNTGMQEFINPEYMKVVECEPLRGVMGFDTGAAFKPDKEQIKEHIIWIYEHPDEANDMGKRASDWVRTNWTYDRTAKLLMGAVDEFSRR